MHACTLGPMAMHALSVLVLIMLTYHGDREDAYRRQEFCKVHASNTDYACMHQMIGTTARNPARCMRDDADAGHAFDDASCT